MKKPFIEALTLRATEDERIVLLTGDLGFNALEPFAERFPDRFFNVGVAEQSMIGIAAGMASAGLRPFVYSIANFSTFRAAEQVRNDVAYHGLDVVIVAVGGGVSYGHLGYSHHLIQDYSLMLGFPGMTILAPADGVEASLCVEFAVRNGGPTYLRLDRSDSNLERPIQPDYLERGVPVALGGPRIGSERTCIVYTGGATDTRLPWLEGDQSVARFTVPVWGKESQPRLIEALRVYRHIVTVESHLTSGFGTWVLGGLARAQWNGHLESVHLSPSVIGAVGGAAALSETHMMRSSFRLASGSESGEGGV